MMRVIVICQILLMYFCVSSSKYGKFILTVASKPFNICWIRTISHTEKLCIAFKRLLPVLLSQAFGTAWSCMTSFNFIIFHFNIRGKLSLIRCHNELLHSNLNPSFYVCLKRLGGNVIFKLHNKERLLKFESKILLITKHI